MAPQHKGKAPTKGAKQILTENTSTVYFYRNMSLAATLLYNFVSICFYFESICYGSTFMNFFVIVIYFGCYQLMCYISRPQYADNSLLVDPGLDLNMEGGMGEHIKDIVILASITHVLALISNYFWGLLILMPLRMLWLLWKHIIAPWIFQAPPSDPSEVEEKKRKKMERRMKRLQM